MQPSYRNYLQTAANGGDVSAHGLLQLVGDDGRLNDYYQSNGGDIGGNFNGNPYNFSKDQLNGLNKSYYQNYGASLLGDTTNTPGYARTGTGGGGGSVAPPHVTDFSQYDANAKNLNDLLGRTDTSLNNGLSTINDQYNNQVKQSNLDKTNQINAQNTGKQNAYDRINQNAGIGYKSLAGIIGRSAGTGSSAYRELLPDVIGKDTSSKRLDTTNTYGQNLSNIDTSFQNVLQDLANQKKQNEDTLRSGVEGQRQGIQQQLASNAEARAQAAGQTPAQAVAAAAPFQNAIINSRNAVDSFFNQFRPTYNTPTPNLNLAQYQTDPAAVSAAQNGQDANNPYGALLRKKLQGAQ